MRKTITSSYAYYVAVVMITNRNRQRQKHLKKKKTISKARKEGRVVVLSKSSFNMQPPINQIEDEANTGNAVGAVWNIRKTRNESKRR